MSLNNLRRISLEIKDQISHPSSTLMQSHYLSSTHTPLNIFSMSARKNVFLPFQNCIQAQQESLTLEFKQCLFCLKSRVRKNLARFVFAQQIELNILGVIRPGANRTRRSAYFTRFNHLGFFVEEHFRWVSTRDIFD